MSTDPAAVASSAPSAPSAGPEPPPGLERDRLARVALCRLAEPGDPRMAGLVAELGAVRVHDHLAGEQDVDGVLKDVASRLRGLDPVRELEQAARLGIRFVVPGDAEWPIQLGDLDRAEPLQQRGGVPLGLWAKGPLRLDTFAESVSVVGSRSSTSYGTDIARDLAAGIANADVGVVSGAAFGIDQAAHRGALAVRGPTAAVLACGVDRAYPKAHKPLLDYIAEVGVVISELAPGCAPMRMRFLSRNRIIAAMSKGTVVVEAAIRSGALNTANWAERLSRPVMGVPGPVTSAPSQGVHQLIRAGSAMLVTSAVEVLEVVGVAGAHLLEDPRADTRPRDRLREREQQVLDAVPAARPAAVDSIARTAGIGLVEVRSVLGRLQQVGLVVSTDTGWVLGEEART
ncbi:DNA-processing protein DprA [Nocardioides speluncae]|uniref:DNA-processing protein DprA n=1 Tax=Nocardioides speluncae TaxID=2670337 RepID=UPI000D69F984|nr:DNA-processing protein DprA [Nocardioides speluncae]